MKFRVLIPLFFCSIFLVSCSKDDNTTLQNTIQESSSKVPFIQKSLHVMSYNIFHLPGIASVSHYKEKERAIAQLEYLKSMRNSIDVIVFQEGFNQQAETYLLDKLSRYYPYNTRLVGQFCYAGNYWNSISGNCSNSPFVVNGGVTIYSKYPILEKHQLVFEHSGYGTPDYYANKGAAFVKIKKDNYIYNIVGTHLQADHNAYNGSSVRLRQLREIKNWITGFSISKNEPLIYAGDMNVEYTNPSDYAQMKHILHAEINYTFNPSTEMGTYSNQNTIVVKNYPNYNDSLDYILHSTEHKSPVTPPEMKVLRPMKNGEDLSDHFPVFTKYSFRY